MPKIKQVSSKRPRVSQSGFEPPKRAIKSAVVHTSRPESPRRLPVIPSKISRIIQTARKGGSPAKTARKSVIPSRGPVLQKSRFLNYSIPKRTFQKLCRDISYTHLPECRFTLEALTALQTALEDFMVGFFEDAAMCMRHANRRTLFLKDMELVARLRRFDYEPL